METTTKHTAGPWLTKVEGTSSGRWPIIYTAGPYYDDGSSREVCNLETIERNDGACPDEEWVRKDNADEIEANARLIAAAPELLEACKRAKEILDAWGPERRGDTLERLHERMSGVIAKATGEAVVR